MFNEGVNEYAKFKIFLAKKKLVACCTMSAMNGVNQSESATENGLKPLSTQRSKDLELPRKRSGEVFNEGLMNTQSLIKSYDI